MTGLRLAQLPDRVPVKLTITVPPELKKALDDYALLYAKAYGAEEQVTELIPYMLDLFLKGDHVFRKERKGLNGSSGPPAPRSPRRTRSSAILNSETG